MTHSSLADETTIRLSIFIGIFAVIAVWEVVSTRRELQGSKYLHPLWLLVQPYLNTTSDNQPSSKTG